jgi:hypothetical protein
MEATNGFPKVAWKSKKLSTPQKVFEKTFVIPMQLSKAN